MDFASLLVPFACGCIGVGAWRYGRKRDSARHMLIGVALIGYPWVVSDPWWTVGIGAALTGLLFVG